MGTVYEELPGSTKLIYLSEVKNNRSSVLHHDIFYRSTEMGFSIAHDNMELVSCCWV